MILKKKNSIKIRLKKTKHVVIKRIRTKLDIQNK